MNKTKNTCQLRHFEVPLAIYIIHEPFTMANKMLTKTSKICRPALRQKYTKILEELNIRPNSSDFLFIFFNKDFPPKTFSK